LTDDWKMDPGSEAGVTRGWWNDMKGGYPKCEN